jgi:hypothetical protein
MKGRVEADAKYYKLPYDVLVGRDSDILTDYQIIKLPQLLIIGRDRSILFTQKYVSYEKLKEELDHALKEKR